MEGLFIVSNVLFLKDCVTFSRFRGFTSRAHITLGFDGLWELEFLGLKLQILELFLCECVGVGRACLRVHVRFWAAAFCASILVRVFDFEFSLCGRARVSAFGFCKSALFSWA